MAVKASASVTLSRSVEVESITPYYLLKSSTSAKPAKPVTNPPPAPWSKAEPAYAGDMTVTLYMTILNVFTDGTFQYTDVNVSSSYEAAKDAYAKAQAARKVAENFIHTDSGTNGLVVNNNQTVGSGYDVQLIANAGDTGMNIRKDGNILAHFGENLVELGKNSAGTRVQMCGGKAGVSARYGGIIDVYSNNAEYDTTLDFDFNEDVFKAKVGTHYDFYDFIYTGEDGWELIENSYQPATGPVSMAQFGITVHTAQINDYAGIQVVFIEGSHVKLFNTDTQTGSRKLELELAEDSSTEQTDYANICIERQTQEYEGGDKNEHSIINMMTVHDSGNHAEIQLFDGEISIMADQTYFNGGPVYDNCFNIINGSLVGEIKLFAGSMDNVYAEGWLICDGSAVDRITYAQLFNAIGTTYGAGDGSTTFNLPDLRGRVPIGQSSSYALGAKGGAATHTLTAAQIPAHTHGSAGAHTHSINNCSAAGSKAPQLESYEKGNSKNRSISTNSAGGHTHASVGGGEAHNNMQPYVAMNYIIFTGAMY